jgi:hypothetical protein
MKTKLFLNFLMCFLVSYTIVAQNVDDDEMQTLFGDGEVSFGGYGGPKVAYSSFDGRNIWLVGGRGGVIINHSLVLGGGGYGIVNSPVYENFTYKDKTYSEVYLQGGYGGFIIEGIIWPKKLVHVSVPVLIGAGGIMFTDQRYPDEHSNFENHVIVHNAFFVVEPGVEVELNVVRFMRLTAGVSYRYAPKLELPNIASGSFNALTASISLKFGKF